MKIKYEWVAAERYINTWRQSSANHSFGNNYHWQFIMSGKLKYLNSTYRLMLHTGLCQSTTSTTMKIMLSWMLVLGIILALMWTVFVPCLSFIMFRSQGNIDTVEASPLIFSATITVGTFISFAIMRSNVLALFREINRLAEKSKSNTESNNECCSIDDSVYCERNETGINDNVTDMIEEADRKSRWYLERIMIIVPAVGVSSVCMLALVQAIIGLREHIDPIHWALAYKAMWDDSVSFQMKVVFHSLFPLKLECRWIHRPYWATPQQLHYNCSAVASPYSHIRSTHHSISAATSS